MRAYKILKEFLLQIRFEYEKKICQYGSNLWRRFLGRIGRIKTQDHMIQYVFFAASKKRTILYSSLQITILWSFQYMMRYGNLC